MSVLQGRVFARHSAFLALPDEQQQRVLALADALFNGPQKLSSPSGSEIDSARLVKAVTEHLVQTKSDSDGDEVEATTPSAETLVDQLVLSGRLALAREDDTSAAKQSKFVGKGVVFTATQPAKKSGFVSVWSVRDGAIQAGTLKRAGKFSKLFGGKESYFVVNEKRKTLFWFDSDASTQVKGEMRLEGTAVQFDPVFPFGIKVAKEKAIVYLGVGSKEKQDEWLNSVINGGAVYREAFNLAAQDVQSIYELKDYDMQGNAVSIDKYKGKVLLVVNVSSNCGLTPTNYPALVELDRKYRDQGLEILAFPCNQFALQEPGSHEEIMAFVKKYNCEFPFFEKSDVNGANARPVFTYLKAKLPTSFGSFVKWNFTKFLVDRNGQPYKRFSPYDLPTSFEDDIELLLAMKEGASVPPVAAAAS
ncbi:Phospholipid hydroperoxide glutathione [Globisporangium polare]